LQTQIIDGRDRTESFGEIAQIDGKGWFHSLRTIS
jgi:hypothetical protein